MNNIYKKVRVVMVFAESVEGSYIVICVYGEMKEGNYTMLSRFNKFIIRKNLGRRSIKRLLKRIVGPEYLRYANCSDSLEYIKHFFNKRKKMNILRIYEKEV